MERTGAYQLSQIRARPSNATEMFDYIIGTAIKMGASDIHLGSILQKNIGEQTVIRYRVHGTLHLIKNEILGQMYREVVTRIKVLASMNTADSTVPQDGQITVAIPEGLVVLRISTLPSGQIGSNAEAEDVVIRVQKADSRKYSLDEFIIRQDMRNKFNQLVQQKSGLIIVSGPAGSGKTTLVYSFLNAIACPEKKVLTAEDPVEVKLPYVSHTQISQKTNFAALSRTFMRQNSDVIFIGEIRDPESASAAVQLAQTGHLVLTTLHTRDSIGVISRLEAFDVHPNFIANTLIGSINIRLAQQLCEHCRVDAQLTSKIIAMAHKMMAPPPNAKFYKAGPGCKHCVAGVVGQMPILELFVPDAELADLINRRASKIQIFEAARRKGMRTLGEDALIRAYNGYIDLMDVYSYVFSHDYAS